MDPGAGETTPSRLNILRLHRLTVYEKNGIMIIGSDNIVHNPDREAQLAVPTPDHFLPMLYIMALREANEPLAFFNDKAIMGSLTMTSFRVG
jgi:aromatic ring-opening dioxygenase catalytic subunit (LigB family)